MRVIFINRYFHPDFSATSQMLSDLAFSLAAGGFDVTVVSSRQLYDTPGARLHARETVNGVKIRRVSSTTFGRGGVAGRLLDYLSFHIAVGFALLRLLARGDVVVAKTDPPLLSVTVSIAARLRGAVFVNWLQDLFPEVLGAVAGNRRVVRMALRMLVALRNSSLRAADCNVAIGRLMANRVESLGVERDHIEIIENWCDGRVVRPLAREQSRLRTEWGLADALVVGYSGNLGVAHEFDTIVRAVEELRERDDIKFLFIGAGARLPALQRRVRDGELSNVVFKPYQERERLAESLSAPDIHLVCLRSDMEGLVVPSKFYGVLAAGRPCLFVGDPQGEIATALRELGCGRAIAPGDSTALASLIRQFADHRIIADSMGAIARRAFELRSDRSIAVERWTHLLNGLEAAQRHAGLGLRT
jgi:glycosyltransferase involved in cell wall biosynthesis